MGNEIPRLGGPITVFVHITFLSTLPTLPEGLSGVEVDGSWTVGIKKKEPCT